MAEHRVLIVDDEQLFLETLADLVEDLDCETLCAQTLQQAVSLAESNDVDIVLLDVRLPDGSGLDVLPRLVNSPSRPEVIILTGLGDPDGAELAIKNGAWDYLNKAASTESTKLTITRALQFRTEKKAGKDPATERQGRRDEIVGDNQALKSSLDVALLAAPSDVSVLITGETGTGKELLVKVIHDNSPRRGAHLTTVDCAALSPNIVEGELFGHVKGAFTSADRDREGLIVQAHQGTLFLDEVGEMPMTMQKAFLRVLQEKRFRPVGGKKEIPCDFRVVAATNRDLEVMVREGRFRQDLLYRLNAVRIHLPPLRERIEDIQPLALHYINRFCQRNNLPAKQLSPELLLSLAAFPWPGNIRELTNTLESVLTFSGEAPTLFPVHLPEHIRIHHARIGTPGGERETNPDQSEATPPPPLLNWKDYRERAMNKVEQDYFLNLLAFANGDTAKALDLSGLSKARFYKLLKKARSPL